MHVLTVSNNKGGVGKTTLTLHLGAALAEDGKKVLLVDADPQGTLTRWLLDAEPTEGLAQLVADDYGAGALVEDVIAATAIENLFVLPAGSNLEVAYGQMQGLAVNRIRDALDDINIELDIVLVDSPPRLGAVAEALLIAADSVLYPVDGGSESVVALQKLSRTVSRVQKYRPSLLVLGFVRTRTQRNATQRLVGETLEELYGDLPVKSGIPESAFVLQAAARRRTVFDLAATNRQAIPCAQAYRDVANTVAEVAL